MYIYLFCFAYTYTLNGNQVLSSLEELCITHIYIYIYIDSVPHPHKVACVGGDTRSVKTENEEASFAKKKKKKKKGNFSLRKTIALKCISKRLSHTSRIAKH